VLLPELRPLRVGSNDHLLRFIDVALPAFVDRTRRGGILLHPQRFITKTRRIAKDMKFFL
jgi:hypothetical protein